MKRIFNTNFTAALASIAILGMIGVLGACQPRHVEPDPWTMEAVELNVRSSHGEVLVNEVVTFTAATRNTYGRDARVEWEAAGAEIDVEQEGRIARGRFERPGTYAVTARLYIDDELRRTDTAQVRVRPVNGEAEFHDDRNRRRR